MIDVSPRDYFHTHKGLVKLLRLIEKSGSTGIATRKLCLEAFRSKDSFCIKLLESAKTQGYITRTPRSSRPSRGNTRKMNKLTASGRKLLQQLDGINDDNDDDDGRD